MKRTGNYDEDITNHVLKHGPLHSRTRLLIKKIAGYFEDVSEEELFEVWLKLKKEDSLKAADFLEFVEDFCSDIYEELSEEERDEWDFENGFQNLEDFHLEHLLEILLRHSSYAHS